MRVENILLVGVGLYLVSKYSKPTYPNTYTAYGPCPNGQIMTNLGCEMPSAGVPPPVNAPVQWIDCNSPNADPIMCQTLEGF